MTGFMPRPPGPAAAPDVAQLLDALLRRLADDPNAVARLHQAADVDGSALALHHTLGGDALQAAAGNHGHAGYLAAGDVDYLADIPGAPRTWSAKGIGTSASLTTETLDDGFADAVGPVLFTATAGFTYTVSYACTLQAIGGPAAMEARIRARDVTADTTLPVLTSSTLVATAAVPQGTTSGGSSAATVIARETWKCAASGSGVIAPGAWKIAGTAIRTSAGAGNTGIAIVRPSGAARTLMVEEARTG